MTTPNTMSQSQTAPLAAEQIEESPFVIEFFMVQALGFRGMAYLDADSKWRRAFDDAPVYGPVKIIE
jgi:hypothetical protein